LRNIVERGSVSSDGEHAINGFHPLSQLVVTGIYARAKLIRTTELVPLLTVLVSLACVVGAVGLFGASFLRATRRVPAAFVAYDLGGVRSVHSLLVQNRRDAHQDRAVPLVASVSVDGVTFREVARQSYWFELWKADFAPVEARYFRLSVARVSILHLERVELR
jgi:hypothetical protein